MPLDTLEYLGIPTNRVQAYLDHLSDMRAKAAAEEQRRASLQQAAVADARAEQHRLFIAGKVIQRLDNGLLVQVDRFSENGALYDEPRDYPTILLTDYPSPVIDDDRLKAKVYLIGVFEYASTLGSTKTVRKYTYSKSVAVEYWNSAP
jgi:hypothetical protein